MKETGDTKQDIPTIFIRTKPIANLLTVLEASARNKARTFSHSGTYAGIPPHLHTIGLGCVLLRLWRFFCCFELFLLRLCRWRMKNKEASFKGPSFISLGRYRCITALGWKIKNSRRFPNLQERKPNIILKKHPRHAQECSPSSETGPVVVI